MSPTFDPHAPYLDQKTGFRYADFGDFLAGRPEKGRRSDGIALFREQGLPKTAERYWRAFDAAPEGTDDDRFHVALAAALTTRSKEFNPSPLVPIPLLPPGLHTLVRSVGRAARNGQSGAQSAPADPVHAADQPVL